MKMLYKVEENLKQITKNPSMAKLHYGGPEAKTPSAPPKSQFPSGYHCPPKKDWNTRKTNRIPLSIHHHRTPPNLLSASPIFKVFAQIDLEEYLFHLTRFCYDKVIRGCCKTVSSSIVIRNGKV